MMKKIFLTTVIAVFLLVIGACVNETSVDNIAISNSNDNKAELGIFDDSDEVETIWVMGDYPHYNSISDLASYATDVVRVEVLNERVEWLNTWLEPPPPEIHPYNLYTIHRIRVLEVFQGDAEIGDILEVRQIGGQQDGLRVINEDEVPLAIGDDLVLFLRASYIENFPSVLLNPYQSAYYSPSENALIDIDEDLESVNPDNDLVLTTEDLIQIAEDDYASDN